MEHFSSTVLKITKVLPIVVEAKGLSAGASSGVKAGSRNTRIIRQHLLFQQPQKKSFVMHSN